MVILVVPEISTQALMNQISQDMDFDMKIYE